jgi:hypothetical protein
MRTLVLIAAVVVLASASAQAGESRSLSAYPVSNDTTATVQPAASKSLRADNDAPAAQPAETPRYSPPPADTTSNPPLAETPHYTARPAPVDNAPRSTTAATAPAPAPAPTHTPSDDYSPREVHGRHMMRAERGHHHRLTAGRIIAALHRYGIYW